MQSDKLYLALLKLNIPFFASLYQKACDSSRISKTDNCIVVGNMIECLCSESIC